MRGTRAGTPRARRPSTRPIPAAHARRRRLDSSHPAIDERPFDDHVPRRTARRRRRRLIAPAQPPRGLRSLSGFSPRRKGAGQLVPGVRDRRAPGRRLARRHPADPRASPWPKARPDSDDLVTGRQRSPAVAGAPLHARGIRHPGPRRQLAYPTGPDGASIGHGERGPSRRTRRAIPSRWTRSVALRRGRLRRRARARARILARRIPTTSARGGRSRWPASGPSAREYSAELGGSRQIPHVTMTSEGDPLALLDHRPASCARASTAGWRSGALDASCMPEIALGPSSISEGGDLVRDRSGPLDAPLRSLFTRRDHRVRVRACIASSRSEPGSARPGWPAGPAAAARG